MWRLLFAIIGTGIYALLFRPDWRVPYCLLYDVPTVPIAFGFGGAVFDLLCHGTIAQAMPRMFALLASVGLAAGAQFRQWPLSGHLTVATTVGLLEMTDRHNPLWLRIVALLPIVLLLLIRNYRPQSALMGNRRNTTNAVFLGLALGGAALWWLAYGPTSH